MKDGVEYNLEERLIKFGLNIMNIVDLLPNTLAGNHIGGQMIRSGTSPAFNYGEAQAAESKKDFLHKMRICLKELKETYIALQFIIRKPLLKDNSYVLEAEIENKELILIFSKSIKTTKNNLKNETMKIKTSIISIQPPNHYSLEIKH